MDTLGLQVRTLRYLPDNQTYVGLINTVSTADYFASNNASYVAFI
jgi:hypothetical protein